MTGAYGGYNKPLIDPSYPVDGGACHRGKVHSCQDRNTTTIDEQYFAMKQVTWPLLHEKIPPDPLIIRGPFVPVSVARFVYEPSHDVS